MINKSQIIVLIVCGFTAGIYAADISSRIVGGEIAEDGTTPFMVSLTGMFGHRCGGAIIEANWILTAGHCVFPFGRFSKVIIGTNDLEKPGGTHYIMRRILHPNFNDPLYHNDIALLRINKVKFSARVQKIKISPQYIRSGTPAMIVGWGLLETNNENTTNILRSLNLTVISNEECRQRHSTQPENVSDGHLCTMSAGEGHGACNGDSGGPLFIRNENNEYELIGNANWAVKCARGYPDVFARASYYYDWIKSTIEKYK